MSRTFAAIKVDDCPETHSLISFVREYLRKGKQNILFVTDDRFHVFKAGKSLILCRSIKKPAIAEIIIPLGFALGVIVFFFFGMTWGLIFPALVSGSSFFLSDTFLHMAFRRALDKRKYKGKIEKVEKEDLLEMAIAKELEVM